MIHSRFGEITDPPKEYPPTQAGFNELLRDVYAPALFRHLHRDLTRLLTWGDLRKDMARQITEERHDDRRQDLYRSLVRINNKAPRGSAASP